ncbi:hypothetical protein ACFPYJ_07980 [Paenibacillus solisilvae]|uniref:Cyclophilin-like domain-containing protein n=1 Tax=Paenibacillus solisilvae TaxID=2486751 RepID=A0ABW0VWH2_9BACL
MIRTSSFVFLVTADAVGDYLLSVGNIKSVPAFADYTDLSLLKAVDPSLIKVEIK